MAGLHDKRATGIPRRSKRLERSKPEAAAAAPPARRAKHGEGPVPPRKRKRESSVPAARRRTEAPVPPPKRGGPVPAARVARPPSPPYGDRNSGDATVAPPPPARRTEAPAPPPKHVGRGRITMPSIAYGLRNRLVLDTSNPKPVPTPTPRPDEKGYLSISPPSAAQSLPYLISLLMCWMLWISLMDTESFLFDRILMLCNVVSLQ
jgi:hypothetical protein